MKDTSSSSSNNNYNVLVGNLRKSKEVTEIGCLLMLVGLAEIIQPLTWIAGLINGGTDDEGNPTTITTGLSFATLFGYLCCVTIGVMSVLVGYVAAFHPRAGNPKITTFVAVFVQTAYILTVASCMNITRVASSGKNYEVPPGSLSEYEQPNARLLAAMGVLAILAYWFGMLGSISVLLGSLIKFQSNKGHERDGTYYGGRLLFYSFILFLAGLSQTVVGVQLYMIYGTGPIPENSFYKVAMLIVTYPVLSIVVGCVQMFNGLWGMLRKLGILVPKEDSGLFVCMIWAGWFIQLVIQIIVQPSILPGAAAARAPPTLTAFSFGMNFMPAYLDSKAKSLPENIDADYYGEIIVGGSDDNKNRNETSLDVDSFEDVVGSSKSYNDQAAARSSRKRETPRPVGRTGEVEGV
mmetsp:Transcript_56978/g.138810  ORF Transcript_56978/g.138810 Transcript_56978/m.138810 type:complete len:408 (+) Transcript_56978:176-1399(+)